MKYNANFYRALHKGNIQLCPLKMSILVHKEMVKLVATVCLVLVLRTPSIGRDFASHLCRQGFQIGNSDM